MRPRGLLVGLVMAVAIVYFIFFARVSKHEKGGLEIMVDKYLETKIKLTDVNLGNLAKEIFNYTSEGEGLPESLEALRRFHPTAGSVPDAWGTRIRYLRLSDSSFRLTSAGPDKTFDTADDIVRDF